ncbi:MAG: hypothetical protein KDL87_14340, partial [Verrucomicrobiae bacterium]|nr:hypothetical protein [Verrucomicrobiae bacterium]
MKKIRKTKEPKWFDLSHERLDIHDSHYGHKVCKLCAENHWPELPVEEKRRLIRNLLLDTGMRLQPPVELQRGRYRGHLPPDEFLFQWRGGKTAALLMMLLRPKGPQQVTTLSYLSNVFPWVGSRRTLEDGFRELREAGWAARVVIRFGKVLVADGTMVFERPIPSEWRTTKRFCWELSYQGGRLTCSFRSPVKVPFDLTEWVGHHFYRIVGEFVPQAYEPASVDGLNFPRTVDEPDPKTLRFLSLSPNLGTEPHDEASNNPDEVAGSTVDRDCIKCITQNESLTLGDGDSIDFFQKESQAADQSGSNEAGNHLSAITNEPDPPQSTPPVSDGSGMVELPTVVVPPRDEVLIGEVETNPAPMIIYRPANHLDSGFEMEAFPMEARDRLRQLRKDESRSLPDRAAYELALRQVLFGRMTNPP